MDKMKKRAVMWVTFLTAGTISALFLDSILILPSLNIYIRSVGAVIIIISFLLLRASGRALKKYGMREKKSFGETDTLVTSGIYSYIRHPHHTGIMLFIIGFGLLLGSMSFVLVIAPILVSLVIIFVIKVEEPEAIRKFGEAYVEYSRRVPRFIPRLRRKEQ